MKSAHVRIGLLLASMAALAPLAYASPPDPSWVAGIYDEADLDDVVQLATSIDAPASSGRVEVAVPVAAPAEICWLRAIADAPAACLAPFSTRAPPVPLS